MYKLNLFRQKKRSNQLIISYICDILLSRPPSALQILWCSTSRRIVIISFEQKPTIFFYKPMFILLLSLLLFYFFIKAVLLVCTTTFVSSSISFLIKPTNKRTDASKISEITKLCSNGISARMRLPFSPTETLTKCHPVRSVLQIFVPCYESSSILAIIIVLIIKL